MKTKKFFILSMLAMIPFFGFAQEWDDIYASPNNTTVRKKAENKTKRVVIIKGDANNMRITANGRDIDEYNRRNKPDTLISDGMNDNYKDYQYTDRIIKFHDPESSIRINGADEVTVYVDNDVYSDYYRNRGWDYRYGFGFSTWDSYYPWYTSRPYYGYYSPWHYRHYSPFYYGGFYDPWYYGSYYGGYYGGFYDPWYYGGYYSPYYGGYYGHYGSYWDYPYYGGYYSGYYDGYRNSSRSTSGRTSGTYRSDAASTRALTSGRGIYTRGSDAYSGSRTRVIDNQGRVLDSRSGRVIEDNTSRMSSGRSSSVYTRGSAYDGSSSSRVYDRTQTYDRGSRVYDSPSSRSTYDRSYSTPSRSTYDSSSSRSYDSGSRSSSMSTRSYDSSSSRSSSYSSSSSSGRTGSRR